MSDSEKLDLLLQKVNNIEEKLNDITTNNSEIKQLQVDVEVLKRAVINIPINNNGNSDLTSKVENLEKRTKANEYDIFMMKQ